jgi:hypothetical protein
VFATMHLWVTALTQTITGIQWLALAFKKSRQTAAARAATTSPELQRFVAKRVGATTVETASSHVLMLSSPGLVLDIIRKAFGVVQKV